MRNRVELSEKYTGVVHRDRGVVAELQPPTVVGVGQHPDAAGLVHPEQPAVGVADYERAVARVGL
jgi:hypothetical protein